MRIEISSDKNTIIEKIRMGICTTEQYQRMDYKEKYSCLFDYYGDVSDDGFIICKTSRGIHRNGIQHLSVKGEFIDEKNKVVLSVKPVINGAHFLVSVIMIAAAIYSIFNNNALFMIVPSLFFALTILASLNEYKDASLFIIKRLCDE